MNKVLLRIFYFGMSCSSQQKICKHSIEFLPTIICYHESDASWLLRARRPLCETIIDWLAERSSWLLRARRPLCETIIDWLAERLPLHYSQAGCVG